MEKEYTISLKELFTLFLKKLWVIVLVTVICGVAGFGYSKLFLPLEYSSHISMYVQSYTDISENTAFNQNNISNSKQLVNTYIEVLKDDAVMIAVGEMLAEEFDSTVLSDCFTIENERITPASLRACLSITSVTDTSALTVKTTTKNPEVAAAICNDLASVSQQYIEEAVGVGSISTIDTARVYNNPVAPNSVKNAALAAIAGMVLTMVIIFLIDFFDNSVKDTDTLANRYEKAIIGEVQGFGPDKKERKKMKDDKKDDHVRLTDKDVPFYVVESYKSIRTNVTFALSTYEKKILAVSSANPAEGKSTTAANIAIASAQGGNKVLLIDADMRKSVQHKIFSLKNKRGLSSAISKINKIDECIQRNVMENLDIMTAGPIPPNPSELLSSDSAKKLLEELSSRYALIVIDLPPVCVVSDALTLSEDVSGMIMVVRYGYTSYDDVEEANKRMELANMNLLGFILNDAESKTHGSRYYHKYGKYGRYGKYTKYGYGSRYGYRNYEYKSEEPESDK